MLLSAEWREGEGAGRYVAWTKVMSDEVRVVGVLLYERDRYYMASRVSSKLTESRVDVRMGMKKEGSQGIRLYICEGKESGYRASPAGAYEWGHLLRRNLAQRILPPSFPSQPSTR
jgi:hypothetical protein